MSRPPNPEISPLRASCRAGTPLIAFAPWSVQFKKQMKSMDHLSFPITRRSFSNASRTTQHGEDNTMQCSVHAERASDSEAQISPEALRPGDQYRANGKGAGPFLAFQRL